MSSAQNERPFEDELPLSFSETLFHIVFMYATNVTVLSKISRKIVYQENFSGVNRLSGIQLDIRSHMMLIFGANKLIKVASLSGEDKNAWKYYLK